MPEDQDSHTSEIKISGNSTVDVHGDMVGGSKHTYNTYIFGKLPINVQLELFGQDLGLTLLPLSQHELSVQNAYNRTWKSLQALRLRGDALWERATDANLATFANQLRKTKRLVQEGGIFFVEHDYDELLRVLDAFGRFQVGKRSLIDLFLKGDNDKSVNEWWGEIEDGIEGNRHHKEEYEQILDRIRRAFHKRLGNRARASL